MNFYNWCAIIMLQFTLSTSSLFPPLPLSSFPFLFLFMIKDTNSGQQDGKDAMGRHGVWQNVSHLLILELGRWNSRLRSSRLSSATQQVIGHMRPWLNSKQTNGIQDLPWLAFNQYPLPQQAACLLFFHVHWVSFHWCSLMPDSSSILKMKLVFHPLHETWMIFDIFSRI